MATSATTKRNEYADLSSDELEDLNRQDDALELSIEFCQPHFDKFVRFMDLYSGKLPEAIDFTFSKVMLRLATSIVQNDIPRTASAILSENNFFKLTPNLPEFEEAADAAQGWLWYHTMKRNRYASRVIPTLTQVGIYGTAFRSVMFKPLVTKQKVRYPGTMVGGVPYNMDETEIEQTKMGIVSENLDIFSVMPSPTGTVINSIDTEEEDCVDWIHMVRYLSDAQLKAMQQKRGANKRQIQKMLDSGTRVTSDARKIDDEYRQDATSSMLDSEYGDWMNKVRLMAGNDITPRRRCVWTFFRDQWILTGEGRYLLYSGPPLLDWIPITRYVDTPHPSCIYGTGLIETVEDVILSYLLNYGLRADYLAMTLHPSTWISDELVNANGGNLSSFDPAPWATYRFPRNVDITRAIWRDRFPEISPQAFMEETNMRYYFQELLGQPNYGKGMSGAATLANETAVGITALIEEGSARSSMRSLNIENTGIHDELMLTLKWGERYAWEDELVDVGLTNSGYSWKQVPYDAIDSNYGIELRGTRALANKQSMLRNMLQVLPALMNNPNVPDQTALIQETLKEMGLFTGSMDKFFRQPQAGPMLPGMMPGMQVGSGRGTRGLPGPQAQNLLAGASTPMNEQQGMEQMQALPAEMAGATGG